MDPRFNGAQTLYNSLLGPLLEKAFKDESSFANKIQDNEVESEVKESRRKKWSKDPVCSHLPSTDEEEESEAASPPSGKEPDSSSPPLPWRKGRTESLPKTQDLVEEERKRRLGKEEAILEKHLVKDLKTAFEKSPKAYRDLKHVTSKTSHSCTLGQHVTHTIGIGIRERQHVSSGFSLGAGVVLIQCGTSWVVVTRELLEFALSHV